MDRGGFDHSAVYDTTAARQYVGGLADGSFEGFAASVKNDHWADQNENSAVENQ